jgi:hypothetical protein
MMSKLAAMLTHTVTGNVRASRDLKMRYSSAKMESRELNNGNWGVEKQIRLSAVVQNDVFISDSVTNNPDNFKHTLYDLKRAIVEELFGEFRPLIIELRASIYDEDRDRTRTLLAELENQMFVDGL